MKLTLAQRSLGHIAAGMGIFQGLAWFIMSIICLTYYYEGGYFKAFNSYMGAWNQMAAMYLFDETSSTVLFEHHLNPKDFVVFMFFYVFHSFAWILVSVLQVVAIFRRTSWVAHVYRAWALMVVLVVILDVTLSSFLLSDLRICNDIYGHGLEDIAKQQICTDIIVPIYLIVVKGFVLGVLNFVVSSTLIHMSRDILKAAGKTKNVW